MKKIARIVLIALGIVIASGLIFFGVQILKINKISKEIDDLHERINNSEKINIELYASASEIYDKLSNGNAFFTDKYIELFNNMTFNSHTYDFSECDVFDISKDYSELYLTLASGNAELGIQGIDINKKQGTFEISFDYLDMKSYAVSIDDTSNIKPFEKEPGVKSFVSVTFSGACLSKKFLSEYSAGMVSKTNVDNNDIYIYAENITSDVGILFIGFNEEKISVETGNFNVLHPMGDVNISVATG